MVVGFGTNLNNKLSLFTPVGKGGLDCVSPAAVSIFYWKRKPATGGVRSRCLPGKLSWIPGEERTEAVSSSQERALPALSPRRKPELPSPLEKLLRAEIKTAKAASELLLLTWLSSLPSPQGGNTTTCSNSIWE